MDNCFISISGLSKTYGKSKVLDNVNIELEKGKIYGFIGENGAGKTTLMRIITGMAYQTEGICKVENDLLGKIGFIIENPALIPELTAYENLKYKKILNDVTEEGIINNVLKEVGLEKARDKKIKNFSLGMKQRLGIAMALICQPKLLILDEPINGLDPSGIVEMREILSNLNKKHDITIMLSSHILSELYQLATDYIFISKGRIVKKCSLEELNEAFKKWIVLETDDLEKTEKVLCDIEKNVKIEIVDEKLMHVYNYEDSSKLVNILVKENNIEVKQIYYQSENLEDYYSKIIEKSSKGEQL